MRTKLILRTGLLFLVPPSLAVCAENPRAFVTQVVQTELAADQADHSRWLYYDIDRKTDGAVKKWVAETGNGSVNRVLFSGGQSTTPADQRSAMDRFIHDPDALAKQRKSGQHDDRQSEELLRLLPDAFNWTVESSNDGTTLLHFKPNPSFDPPTWASRVFAAMEGDMRVDNAQHRIASLKGRIVRDVKFCGGLCGSIHPGGTFSVERRQIAPSIWQITETHVHINGVILFFKTISEQEDEIKTQFHQLPGNISLEQAASVLMQQNPNPSQQESAHVTSIPTGVRPHS
jgi:hypothetical protein